VQAVFEICIPSGLPRNIEQCLNDSVSADASHNITAFHGRERVTGVTVSGWTTVCGRYPARADTPATR
jgi:hypothetical protein